jgi:hypothetical protein
MKGTTKKNTTNKKTLKKEVKNKKHEVKGKDEADSLTVKYDKELTELIAAHKKLFYAVAKSSKSPTRTTSIMYVVHAALTKLELSECDRMFSGENLG